MTLRIQKFFQGFLPIIIILFGVHILVHRAFYEQFGFEMEWLVEAYLFLLLLTAGHFFTIRWLFKYKRQIFVKNKAYLAGMPISEVTKLGEQFVHDELLHKQYKG